MISVTELNRAIAAGEFQVHYQPRFSMKTRVPETVEALLRWDKPVPIEAVVSKLEQCGLLKEVTMFVITSAIAHIRCLQTIFGCSPKIAVNISPNLLGDEHFIAKVRKTIEQHGVSPSLIEFEVTESSIAHNIGIVGKMAGLLRSDGHEIALDDFGMGFSGLRYLDMIPASIIKIDRHFIAGLGERQTCDAIVSSVVGLAIEIGLVAVAEGVETPMQLSSIIDMGYNEAQGYLLAKPMSFSDLVPFLRSFTRDHACSKSEARLHTRSLANC